MLVYVLVFSVYLKINMPHYALFLMSGILPWQWFAGADASSHFFDCRRADLRGPRRLPGLRPHLGSRPIQHGEPGDLAADSHRHRSIFSRSCRGFPLLVLPVLIGIQLLLTAAVALLLATFNVFFRDLQQLVIVLLNLAFYVSPIFYPITSVPAAFRPAVLANPMVPVVLGYQDIFYYDRMPSATMTLYALVAAYLLFLCARIAFNHYKDTFADYL